MKKICVLFPGIGYNCFRPLLYFSKKLAIDAGYEIKEVSYTHFPDGLMKNNEIMKLGIEIGFEQAFVQLEEIEWDEYDDILFISKSIGTAIACQYAKNKNLHVHSVLYTPLELTFEHTDPDCIVFSGTKDPWVESSVINKQPYKKFMYEDCNHSLECKDVLKNIDILKDVMKKTQQYIQNISL